MAIGFNMAGSSGQTKKTGSSKSTAGKATGTGAKSKTAAGKAADAAKEAVKESIGFPKMAKGASLWDWLKSGIVFLFAQDKGREMMRGALGEKSDSLASSFNRVFFKRLSRDDENLYALAKKWFNADEREALGRFEWELKKSPWDFEGFKDQMGDLNKAYADANPADSKDSTKKKENPAYSLLLKIVKADGDFEKQRRICGPSLIQEELIEKIGLKEFQTKKSVFIPAYIVGGLVVLFLLILLISAFVILWPQN